MGILDSLGNTAGNFVSSTLARLTGAGLSKGADGPLSRSGQARWSNKDTAKDWRVKLTLPSDSPFISGANSWFEQGPMTPLKDIGGMVFPLTPTILVQHQAHYNPLSQTHNNHPFYAYQNSEVQSFGVMGQFPVQNWEDARHWVATLHFLRTVTKMFFGNDTSGFKGNPPPILKLNGYGDHVLNNVPVVVTNFSVELTEGVDYISTSDVKTTGVAYDEPSQGDSTSWAPSLSMFNVQCQPVYSRESLKNFSMQKFVRGELNGGDGIGFI